MSACADYIESRHFWNLSTSPTEYPKTASDRSVMPSFPVSDGTPDEQLLAGVAAGDQQAFAALFRRRRGEVYRFALHMTGSAATSDDVTQEVFLTMMREAARFDPRRATVLAWLCGMRRRRTIR